MIKIFLDSLFKEIKIRQIFMHQESVLATFGAGITTCVAVDIGYSKMSICCIDEGVILPNSMVKINFGGIDIDLLIVKLLEHKFPFQFGENKNNKKLY